MRRILATAGLALGLALPLPAVLVGYSMVRGSESHTAANHGTVAPRAACPGTVVTVHGTDPVPCDLTPPQRLDVYDVTIDECDHMGGEPIALTVDGPITCEGIDY